MKSWSASWPSGSGTTRSMGSAGSCSNETLTASALRSTHSMSSKLSLTFFQSSAVYCCLRTDSSSTNCALQQELLKLLIALPRLQITLLYILVHIQSLSIYMCVHICIYIHILEGQARETKASGGGAGGLMADCTVFNRQHKV